MLLAFTHKVDFKLGLCVRVTSSHLNRLRSKRRCNFDPTKIITAILEYYAPALISVVMSTGGYPVPSRQQNKSLVGNTEDHLRYHKFKVGQSVNYAPGPRAFFRAGSVYKITQLLPPEGDERQYRIKSAEEPYERVVKETQIKSAA